MERSVGYPGLILNQRFELLEVIGEGGMSVIFKALDYRQQEMGEPEPYIALKILRSSFQNDPRFFTLLAQEAKKSQKLSHPHIVNVFDFDRDHELTFMTMELLKGQSLEQLVQTNTLPKSLKAKKQLALQILDAVIHAHRHDVIHADLKPSNIFVEINTPDNLHTREQDLFVRAKVFDFGIARALHQNSQGFIGCSPAYATPSTINGVVPGPYDDAFGIGCVLYTLFEGRHPYDKRASNTVEFASRDLVRTNALTHQQWTYLKLLLLFPFYPQDFGVIDAQVTPDKREQVQQLVLRWLYQLRESLVVEKKQSHWRSAIAVISLMLAGVTLAFWWVKEPQRREQQVLAYLEQQQLTKALAYIADYKAIHLDSPVSDQLGDQVLDAVMASIQMQLQPMAQYNPKGSRALLDAALSAFRDSKRLTALAIGFEAQALAAKTMLREQLLLALETLQFCDEPPKQCKTDVFYLARQLQQGHPQAFELVRPVLLQGVLRGYALATYQNQPLRAQRIRADALQFFDAARLEALGVQLFQVSEPDVEVNNQHLQAVTSINRVDTLENNAVAPLRTLAQFEKLLSQGLLQQPLNPPGDQDQFFWNGVYAYLVGFQAFTPFQNPTWWNATLPSALHPFFMQPRDIRQFDALKNDHTAVQPKLKQQDSCAFTVADTTVSTGLGACQDQFPDGAGPLLMSVWLANTPNNREAYGLAVSQYELAWQDLQAFCEQESCTHLLQAPLTSPALHLPEAIFEGYLEWLTQKTGFAYRLLRLDEWRALEDPLGLMDSLIGLDGQPKALTCGQLGYVSKGPQLALMSVYQGRYNRFGVYNLSDLSPEVVVSGAEYLMVPGRFERFRRCRIAASAYEYPFAAYRIARDIRF